MTPPLVRHCGSPRFAPRWNCTNGHDENSDIILPRFDFNLLRNEAGWRREVMSAAKDALACGDAAAAYEALTRHEREGYPFATEEPS